MELEGEAPIEGRWVDRVVGFDGVRVDIAMMRTPDGHGRLELTKFHTPTVSAVPSPAGPSSGDTCSEWAHNCRASPALTICRATARRLERDRQAHSQPACGVDLDAVSI
jgi:hypothetical protein